MVGLAISRLAAALGVALVMAACASAPPVKPAVAPAVGPSRCGADPDTSWLDGHDRECATDIECIAAVGDGCEFVSISERGIVRPRYSPHLCTWFGNGRAAPVSTVTSGCMCSVPGLGARCRQGCCQVHISPDGAWGPEG